MSRASSLLASLTIIAGVAGATGCSFTPGNGATDGGHDAAHLDAAAHDGGLDAAIDAAADAAIDAPNNDPDGDGVPNPTDNCPTVANTDQRDHDSDGVGDACDKCPHLADSSDPDGDGDGVGDACDPHPATAGDTRVLWDGFYGTTLDPVTWKTTTATGTWTVSGGALHQTSASVTNGLLVSTVTYANPTVTAALTVEVLPSGNPTAAMGLTAGALGAAQFYDCKLSGMNSINVIASNQFGGSSHSNTSSWSSSSFNVGDPFVLTEQVLGTSESCAASRGVTKVTAMTSAGANAGPIGFITKSLGVGYDYVFVVDSP
jgi:hypothetical protein